VGINFDILILILNIKREITVEGEIGLFNSIMIGEPLYLTDTKINEKQN